MMTMRSNPQGEQSFQAIVNQSLSLCPETLLVLCQITYDFIERDEEPEIRMKQPEGSIIMPGCMMTMRSNPQCSKGEQSFQAIVSQ